MAFSHTEETKRKLSEMRKGKNNPFYGKHHTPEFLARLSKRTKEFNSKRQYDLGPRTFQDLTDLQSAYLAGIIDGEGCITLPKKRNGIIITIGNTNKPLMEWLEKITNKRMYLRPCAKSREPFYVLTICGVRDLGYLLGRLRPFMIVKAPRCDECLKILRDKYGDRLNG